MESRVLTSFAKGRKCPIVVAVSEPDTSTDAEITLSRITVLIHLF